MDDLPRMFVHPREYERLRGILKRVQLLGVRGVILDPTPEEYDRARQWHELSKTLPPATRG
jgi:uncharacterized membrane protein